MRQWNSGKASRLVLVLWAVWAVGCGTSDKVKPPGADAGLDSQVDVVLDISAMTDAAVSDVLAGTDAVVDPGTDVAAVTDGIVATDAEAVTDAVALTDGAADSDAAAETDTTAETDTAGPTDAVAQTDAAVQTDTADQTDAAAQTDTAVATDTAVGTDASTKACDTAEHCAGLSDDLCAGPWSCTGGQCQQGPIVVCDASQDTTCSVNVCDPTSGQCQQKPVANDTLCDDGDPCTADDACQFGTCVGPLAICQCQKSADCAKFDDGNPCNGTLYCESKSKTCVTNPATVVVCNTGADGPCEVSKCDPASGTCKAGAKTNGATCSDNNSCTVGDSCQDGQCEPGTQTCCQQDSDCVAADDGNLCNGVLFCNKAQGKCQLNPISIVTCPNVDDTDCKKNQCQPKTGKCVMTASPNGKPCDDGSACTPSEVCQSGLCTAGANLCACQSDVDCKGEEDGNLCNGVLYCNLQKSPAVCEVNPASVVTCGDDGAACSDPACNPLTGICGPKPIADGTPCDSDGNACTPGDVCLAGQCSAGANLCDCATDSDCAIKEDGDLCNGTLYCNQQSGKCEVNPATVVFCSYTDDTACQQNRCDKASGTCALQPIREGASCDADGNPCTAGDTCEAGSCVAGPNTCPCTSSGQCAPYDDGNFCNGSLYCDVSTNACAVNPATVITCPASNVDCQQNRCDPQSGACSLQVAYNGQWCNGDGNPCTLFDVCNAGQCEAGTNVCQCTNNGDCAAREDGDVCNGSLYCDFTAPPFSCVVNPATVISCPTALDTACLKTTCDKATGQCQVKSTPDGGECEDGSGCTTADTCIGGACLGDQKSCNDNDPCTVDACSASTGACIHKITACGDGNPCTTDTCSPNQGCENVALPNGATCTDSNACTVSDSCQNGQCSGTGIACDDGNPCTLDTCASSGGCVFQSRPDGSSCNDGTLCTTGDTCGAGACKGSPLVCQDGNLCTADACDPADGSCVVSPVAGPCDDGIACTTSDACSGGFCSGINISCDDDDPCTADSCSGGFCTYTATSGGCDDGNDCTEADACSGGLCLGTEVVCADGNLCTDDACDTLGGCSFVANNVPCNDGNACTVGDACKNGSCSGTDLTCDDGNACTDDACTKAKGCTFTASTKPCDDGDACTATSICTNTVCKVSAALNCDDGVACTADSCDKDDGCVHTVDIAICDDDNPCTADLCDGGCIHPPQTDGTPCGGDWQCLAGSCKYARDFAMSDSTNCVVRPDGTVRCWGLGNSHQLGDGKFGNVGGKPWQVPTPTDTMPLASPVASLVGGSDGFFALHVDGKLSFWGLNDFGKGGVGSFASSVPPTVLPVTKVQSLAAGIGHTCAFAEDTNVLCWGRGENGRRLTGDSGDSGSVNTPAAIGLDVGVTEGAVGQFVAGQNTCWLVGTEVRCAGNNSWGQCTGDNTSVANQFSVVSPATGVTLLTAGDNFLCGYGAGGVRCWGNADYGRTGGTIHNTAGVRTPAPRLIAGTEDATALVAKGDTACILTAAGEVKCWGACNSGRCGNESWLSQYQARTVSGLPPVVKLRMGGSTTCAEDAKGQLWCWGNGEYGQLGDGLTGSNHMRGVPTLLPAASQPAELLCAIAATCDDQDPCTSDSCSAGVCASTPVADGTSCGDGRSCQAGQCRYGVLLAAGDDHTCVTRSTGELLCWGRGDKGQLGTGAPQEQLAVPTAVVGLTGVTSVAAEADTTCAVAAGKVYCWGQGDACQLASEATSSAVPVQIAGLTGQAEVAVGQGMVCSRGTNGVVRCWGSLGEGIAPTADPCLPTIVSVPTGLPPSRIDLAGNVGHIFTPVGVFVWGQNTGGQIKPSGPLVYANPEEVSPWSFVRDMDGNGQTLCSGSSFGAIYCSGSNTFGEVTGTPGTTSAPELVYDVFDNTGIISVSVGGHHVCAVAKTDGKIKCWGDDSSGQLGNGAAAGTGFVAAGSLTGMEVVVTGRAHTCALSSAGEVYCWGDGSQGQLGNSQFGSGIGSVSPATVSATASNVPADLCDLPGSCVDGNPCTSDGCDRITGTCVYTPAADGTSCVGGQCSVGTCVQPNVVQIAAGDEFTCARMKDETARCWGLGNSGQLGNGLGQASSLTSVAVTGLAGLTDIAASGARACAVDYVGGIWCWGSGADGALGNNSTPPTNALVPIQVTGTNPAVQLAMGPRHVCARDNIGGVWCWGYNGNGQLGNGTTATSPTTTPQQVQGLLGPARHIAVSEVSSCAVLTSGQIQCWGADSGRLGSKPAVVSATTAHTPVQNLPAAAIDVAPTNAGGCALLVDGSTWCWAMGIVEAWQYAGVQDVPGPTFGTAYAATPTLEAGVRDITSSHQGQCVLLGSRGVSCFGYQSSVGAASGVNPPDMAVAGAPARVFGVAGAVQLSVGTSHSCARTANGAVYCWGNNSVGQLGTGNVQGTASGPKLVTVLP